MQRFEILVVFGRKQEQTSHVVKDEFDFHALVCLFEKEFPERIPHFSAGDDEIFRQNKLFCTFQGIQHILEHFFSRGIIGDVAFSVRGIIGVIHEIAAGFGISSSSVHKGLYFRVLYEDARIFPLCSGNPPVHSARRPPLPE